MTTLLRDLRFTARSLARSPGWPAIVVLTLGLGIGAVVAIFSVAYGVLFQPLPYRDAERLVRIGHVRPDTAVPGASFSPQDFEDLEQARPDLASVAAYSYFPNLSGMNLTGVGEPERVPAATVSGSFFDTLGLPARLGRTLAPEDDRPGRNHVVVVSSALWQRRFRSDPGIVGRQITLDGAPYTVAGVMPPAFQIPDAEVEAWVPLSTVGEDAVPHRREVRWLHVLGRLRPGATLVSAGAGVDALLSRLARQYPASNAGFDRAILVPLPASLTRDVRAPILVLLGAVSLLLLIACVNVANLLLARGSAREREMAIRTALGASRARLVRQLLTESLGLSLAGGTLGVLLARWGIDGLLALAGGQVPRSTEIGLNATVLAFAVLATIGTGLAFGLLPAMHTTGALRGSIEGSGRSGTPVRRGRRLSRGLVLGETAFAVALLFGAGLLIRSFWRLTNVETGLRADSVLAVSITIPDAVYAAEKDAAYRSAILTRLRSLPGVVAVGASKTLPLHGGGEAYKFTVEGRGDVGTVAPEAGTVIVTPGYFAALGIPVLRGRDLRESDIESGAPVLHVNNALTRRLWGNEDPIGKGLVIGKMRLEVVGVVGDVRNEGLDVTPRGTIYVPMSIFPRSSLKIFLRTSSDPAALASAARAAIRGIDPDLPISRVAPLPEIVSATVARPRFLTLLVAGFAAAALLLAALGIYGVISFGVAQRTREIGIRMALGADRASVRRLVVSEGMALAAGGLGLGVAAGLALSRLLRSVLFEIPVGDPATLAAVAALLAGVALVACSIPAARASNLDPQAALRADG